MSKAFTREAGADDDAGDDADDAPGLPALPAGTKNYLTPAGYRRLREELMSLLDIERPKVVETVSWAAKNGDRSENGDYLYGKKRLREIDRRIRFLTKRLEIAEVVDASQHAGSDQVFFGATVELEHVDTGETLLYRIVGPDETDAKLGWISIDSPLARAMLKKRVDDEFEAQLPSGLVRFMIVEVRYAGG